MWKNISERSFYDPDSKLDSSYVHLKEAPVALQIFAVWVPDYVWKGQCLQVALKQIDYFYEQVIQDESRVFLVTDKERLKQCSRERIGAILLLEGADALHGDLSILRLLHRLGVRQIGLTWNHANEAADGIEEERGGGLTRFGKEVIREMKRLGIILDVSHLSVRGFWEVMEEWDLPVLASHSNCRAICPHIRNLEDDQIKALIERDGRIGITFVPYFVHTPYHEASIAHLLKHIEHVCELGGENCIFFGSDFDGIDHKIKDLENYTHIGHLTEALLRHYPESLVKKWAWENGYQFYANHLSP
jgi:membrane dipeptidase